MSGEEDIQDLDSLIIKKAKQFRALTTRNIDCMTRLRRLYGYEIQWGHCDISSQLVEFKVQPRDLISLWNNQTNEPNEPTQHKQAPAANQSQTETAITSDTSACPSDKNTATPMDNVDEQETEFNDVEVGLLPEESSLTSTEKSPAGQSILKKVKSSIRGGQAVTAHSDDVTPQQKGNITITGDRSNKPTSQKTQFVEGILKRSLCLFKTAYTNDSGISQKMQINTEKKTRSSTSLTIGKSYTIGGSIELSMKGPAIPSIGVDKNKGGDDKKFLADVLNAVARISGEFKYEKTTSKTIEEEMTWSINNEMEVQPGTRAEVELHVLEEETVATFKIQHTIKMLPTASELPIYIVKKMKKRNSKKRIVLDVVKVNLMNLFSDEDEERRNIIQVDRQKKQLTFYTEGLVKSVYQVRQIVDMKAYDITTGKPVQLQQCQAQHG